MNNKLLVLVILGLVAILAIIVLNSPRHEVKPKEALSPSSSQEKETGATTSEYRLLPAVKTRSMQAPALESKPVEQAATPSEKATKIAAKEAAAPKESDTPQEDTYKPRKYPDAEKMRHMQERGVALY